MLVREEREKNKESLSFALVRGTVSPNRVHDQEGKFRPTGFTTINKKYFGVSHFNFYTVTVRTTNIKQHPTPDFSLNTRHFTVNTRLLILMNLFKRHEEVIHVPSIVVKSPYGLVKRKCISLDQLQYCNISCVLDYKPLLYA